MTARLNRTNQIVRGRSSMCNNGFVPTLSAVTDKPNIPLLETEVLSKWKKNDTFKESYRRSLGKPLFTFYDGPPFATGRPHYGHILAGTIKDMVTRYAHMSGFCVERRFGWDCHGLPVEYEVDKMLGFKSRRDVLNFGIDNYNETCRSIVMRFSGEWRQIIERLGRWIDFDNDYKTMDFCFMESVWNVFKLLFDKGMVYRSFKVMPYSCACTTPLSNFEANLNYKDVSDPSIVVSFPLQDNSRIELLAWTTTPWTLLSNLALCVNPSFIYVKIEIRQLSSERFWIIAESRLDWLLKELRLNHEDVVVVEKISGNDIAGKHYSPPFAFFQHITTAFRVVADPYVTDDTGTGVVHCAPAFGEDDFRVCVAKGIIQESCVPCPLDEDGVFTEEVGPFSSLFWRDADKLIKEKLKKAGRLVFNGVIVHSYPHCWRSDTPLIYKAVPCWFVRVEDMKEKLLKSNAETNWVPSFVKEKRFHNWLLNAKDWCISRNRFWGTPIPLWVSKDYTQIRVIGSVKELSDATGKAFTDIHRHFVDCVELSDPRGPEFPPLQRVDEVFDCWFESGSMPYSAIHYPFENTEKFENGFPAQFIGEGLDQTRGWFYTLMVISTALFEKAPFRNLIVNGLVLAADGKKMSKRLKNYQDPTDIIDKYGADALRIYLINSPVVRAESLRFREEGVKDVVKDVLLPWYHSYRFFVQELTRYEKYRKQKFVVGTFDSKSICNKNIMDRWIYNETQRLIEYVNQEMKGFRLYTVVPKLIDFLESLTNWYLRLNRERIKDLSEDSREALSILFEVLSVTSKLMAPLAPFMSELIYSNVSKLCSEETENKSVHDCSIPRNEPYDDDIIRTVFCMKAVIIVGRKLREQRQVPVKTPVRLVRVYHREQEFLDRVLQMSSYIKAELNVAELEVTSEMSCIDVSVIPNFKILGSRLGKKLINVQEGLKKLTLGDIESFERDGSFSICGEMLTLDDVCVNVRAKCGVEESFVIDGNRIVQLGIDFTHDPELNQVAIARETVNRIQKFRKELDLRPDDQIIVVIQSEDADLLKTLQIHAEHISKAIRKPFEVDVHKERDLSNTLGPKKYEIFNGMEIVIFIERVED